MMELLGQALSHPIASLAVVGNLILIECMLSVDNAAVIATIVLGLGAGERKKALRYGILGAYIFRGLAICFANLLIHIWWLKPLGGIYLIYMVLRWWVKRRTGEDKKESDSGGSGKIFSSFVSVLGKFWATVLLLELMDLAFSIDNVFAAVAFSPNILLVCSGIFIGMLAMRLVAQWFVTLMGRYPFLETSAFMVIGILGIKLTLSVGQHLFPGNSVMLLLSGDGADFVVSMVTTAVFFVPVVRTLIFRRVRTDVLK